MPRRAVITLILFCLVAAAVAGYVLFISSAEAPPAGIDGIASSTDGAGLLPLDAFTIATTTPVNPIVYPHPAAVNAIYVTYYTSENPSRMAALMDLAAKSDVNAMVIDVKDNYGSHISSSTAEFVARLNAAGVYTIARMSVFQDNQFAKQRPDLALKTAGGGLWSSKGVYWMDSSSKEVWDYNVDVAKRALAVGFQEVNIDYVRFPSDGDLDAALYPFYDGVTLKQHVMRDFFAYFYEQVKTAYPGSVISADVFADSFLRDQDVGIGQRIKLIAPHVDVLAPMIYPSHYAAGNFGFSNPDAEPYQVTLQTLLSGKRILEAASSTVVVRPWIQSFSLGVEYTPARIQAGIQAVHDAGYDTGWMAWNPSNTYSAAAFPEH